MINVSCSQFRGQAPVQLSRQTRNSDFAMQFALQLVNQEGSKADYLLCDGRDKKCQS
ncbi:hypothetical protein GPAL_3646 [Glaciecola pallidula DSM 14239 = ACAM 615]|jgi:hypothetical protein|uniref:Uncharacterized protein n=1 Tax=Brumicola pallidula DSM 14239 = ACAM 615 TaxID=1121922 RepID=K6ZNM4_9ALTE|nr:hypothetical protein GPAL_3646 [Glaciecola pallidula DSM 14239 = ACAM 615]